MHVVHILTTIARPSAGPDRCVGLWTIFPKFTKRKSLTHRRSIQSAPLIRKTRMNLWSSLWLTMFVILSSRTCRVADKLLAYVGERMLVLPQVAGTRNMLPFLCPCCKQGCALFAGTVAQAITSYAILSTYEMMISIKACSFSPKLSERIRLYLTQSTSRIKQLSATYVEIDYFLFRQPWLGLIFGPCKELEHAVFW